MHELLVLITSPCYIYILYARHGTSDTHPDSGIPSSGGSLTQGEVPSPTPPGCSAPPGAGCGAASSLACRNGAKRGRSVRASSVISRSTSRGGRSSLSRLAQHDADNHFMSCMPRARHVQLCFDSLAANLQGRSEPCWRRCCACMGWARKRVAQSNLGATGLQLAWSQGARVRAGRASAVARVKVPLRTRAAQPPDRGLASAAQLGAQLVE